jgi:D-beta-D-heptose 7-phosphate kinase/D-beta-D-heptose 1-phosphate adenosyltransferase
LTLEQLLERVAEERNLGHKIVTTNGCFDIIHAGHVASIEYARSFGDFLIIGVNTDESVRLLKGAGRPINPVADRMLVLAGLRAVDAVVPFTEDTPAELCAAIRPDVHVKGGDYVPERMAEYKPVVEGGGRIEIAPIVGGLSTTRLLDKIGKLMDDGLLM